MSINVTSTNQKGGITANTVSVTEPALNVIGAATGAVPKTQKAKKVIPRWLKTASATIVAIATVASTIIAFMQYFERTNP